MKSEFPINVLLLTSHCPFHELTGPLAAGAEIAMRRIAEHLARRGHNAHFLTFSDKKVPRLNQINGVNVHIYPENQIHNATKKIHHKAISWMIKNAHHRYCRNYSAQSDSLILETIRAANERISRTFWSYKHIISNIISQHDIDLIHCFSSMPDSLASTINGNKFGIPVIQRMGGRFWYLKYHSIESERSRMRHLSELRYVFSNTASLFFNSEVLKQETRQHMAELGLHMVKSQPVIDIGVEFPEKFQELPIEINSRLSSEACRILCVGKFKDNSKRQDLLLEAAARLPKSKSVQLLFAGSGTNLEKMQLLAKELNIYDRVEFLGDIPHDLVPSLLHASDIFVHPTEFEGSSKAVAEAMLAGKPILGSKIPALEEHIVSYQNGLLAENEPDAFAKKLQELIELDSLRDHLGRNAAEYAKLHFCPHSAILKYEEHFEHLIGKSVKFKARTRAQARATLSSLAGS